MPCRARLRARFWPITARPVMPNSLPFPMLAPSRYWLVRPQRMAQVDLWRACWPESVDNRDRGGARAQQPRPSRGPAAGLATMGAALTDVRGVLVTHLHPDHYGLAGRVREVSGAWVALHPADAALVNDRYDQVDDLLDRIAAWLRDAGAPDSELVAMRDASMAVRSVVVVTPPDVLLSDGDRPDVPGWQLLAVHTPGHTPGHLCFYEERTGLLLSGDHVLPRITANVSLHPQSGSDPLGEYLASLERLRKYADSLVLPAHEWRFEGLGERIDTIIAHHEERLEAT